MKQLELTFLLHRGAEHIALHFEPDREFIRKLREHISLRWSRQHKCWYCACREENFKMISALAKGNYRVEHRELSAALRNRKPGEQTKAGLQPKLKKFVQSAAGPFGELNEEKSVELKNFLQQLALKSYSASTVRTYSNELTQYFRALKNKPAVSADPDLLRRYFQYCYDTLKLSEATLHSRINAVKFYYEQVLGREKFFWEIPRPKKPFQLPKVLSEQEIGRLFNAVSNIKHKAILFTAYSAGLRVSEVVHLKIRDVDSDRMQLFIERAKGKKDRYVNLSILLLDVLRAYLVKTKPMPKVYVFENPDQPGKPYAIRSAQKIFFEAKRKAFVNKDVGIHSLRHSFATHMMEKGIDIRYIKDLLGHLSIKTTERYLHVKREMLVNLPSVLDDLNKNIRLDW